MLAELLAAPPTGNLQSTAKVEEVVRRPAFALI